MDNFEDVLRWVAVDTNATSLVEISDVMPFRGGGCLHILNTDGTPTDAGTINTITKAMLTEHKIYKLSGEMKFGTKTNLTELKIVLRATIDGYQYQAGISYKVKNDVFHYLAKDGSWKPVFDAPMEILAETWFTFSMELDFANTKIKEISIAGKTQDMNSRIYGAVDGTPDRTVTIEIQGMQEGTTGGFELWADSIRLEGR